MTVEIRAVRAEDEATCLDLLLTLSRTNNPDFEFDDRDPAVAFRQLLNTERGEILVADEDGELLGMASVSYNLAMRYGGEYAQLEELIVLPTARGKNVGARLVQTSVDRARERGCREYGLYLMPQTEHNYEFYKKFGFERIGSELRQPLP